MSFRISCMFFASPGALELGFIAECPREVPQLVTTLLSFRSFQSTGSQGVPRFQRFWVHVYPRAMIQISIFQYSPYDLDLNRYFDFKYPPSVSNVASWEHHFQKMAGFSMQLMTQKIRRFSPAFRLKNGSQSSDGQFRAATIRIREQQQQNVHGVAAEGVTHGLVDGTWRVH